MMMRKPRSRMALGLLLGAVLAFGCSDDDNDEDLDPGGATFSGNVSSASTASIVRERKGWLVRLWSIFSEPKEAFAQNTSLEGIVVVIRGEGETAGTTDANGDFLITNAPAEDVVVIFRRGACEASFPVNSVPSRSTLDLVDVTFNCTTASPAAIVEAFQAVLRENPDDPASVPTCIRAGDDNRLRRINASQATFQGEGGETITFPELENDDLVAIDGVRQGVGDGGILAASRVQVLERNAEDACEDIPLT